MESDQLREIIAASVHIAESEIRSCEQELQGDYSDIHRNYFHNLSGERTLPEFYFDAQEPAFEALREKARVLFEAREREYDAVCRRHLDLKDFYGKLSHLRHKGREKLIDGADLLAYDRQIRMSSGSDKGIEIYQRISDDNLHSDSRRESVLLEKALFIEYVSLCKRVLESC